jgi:PAS domain S-box-containing protein
MKEKRHLDISEEELKDLITSFSTFNQVTQKLRSAYRELEEKFGDLNLKLEQTHLELRQSLAEKEKISSYLNNILESLTSGVLAIDLDGNITLFNRAAEEILGYRAEEVIGISYLEVMGKGVEEKLTLPFSLRYHKLHLSERDGEKEVQSKSGEKIPIGFSTSLLKDNEGGILGAVEVFFDLTRLKQMEEEVMKVKTLAALGEMAAVVAHEVKNPLGGIRGFADLLDRDLEEGDPRKKSVKKIMEGVETLDRIVMGLLDYTRPIQLSFHKVEMVKFMDEVMNFFEMDSTQAKTNIRILKNYPEDELFSYVDTEQFRQVVLNLLHNAVQAMPDGGKITVELNPEVETADFPSMTKNKMIILKISDTGMGMNKGTKEKLFTPFFTTKEHGTGLGLSTVKKIVNAHRGDIMVESELGKGTTVLIRLPMAL